MFRSLIQASKGVIVIFSLLDRESFEEVPYWVQQIRSELLNPPLILVGTKLDLGNLREISYCEAVDMAKRLEMPYLETSARDGTNVDQLFCLFMVLIWQKFGLSARLGVEKIG